MSLNTYDTRAAIKALAAVDGETAYLLEAGREGLFVFDTGDHSAMVTIDTQEGIYIAPASNASGASGAWLRQLAVPGEWSVDWFGVPADPASGDGSSGQVQSHSQLTAVVNLANSLKPGRIVFGAKVYTLGAAIPAWTYQVELAGAIGPQGSILVKRYVEASVTRGVLAFGNSGFTVRNLAIRATSGSGGSGISAVLTIVTGPNAGIAVIVDTVISGGVCFNWSVYCNGMSNNASGARGYRGFYIRGGQFFGAKEAVIALVGVQHFFYSGAFADTSSLTPGASALVLQSAGDNNVVNDDWQVQGILSGAANLNYVQRSVFVTPQNGNITVDANSNQVHWYGPTVSGTVTNNAGAGFVRS